MYVYWISNPIQVNQFVLSTDETSMVLRITNEGWSDIEIEEVIVNGRHTPRSIDLGIGYSSLHVGLDTEDEFVKFVPLDTEKIQPKLSYDMLQEQIQMLVHENYKMSELLPTNYGIRIVNDIKIDSVTIKYKFLGFTLVRELYTIDI